MELTLAESIALALQNNRQLINARLSRVTQGTLLLTIGDLDGLAVTGAVDEVDIAKVRVLLFPTQELKPTIPLNVGKIMPVQRITVAPIERAVSAMRTSKESS